MDKISKVVQKHKEKTEFQQTSVNSVNIEKAKEHVLQVGRKLISEDFNFGVNEAVYEDLIRYFLDVPGKLDLNKGLSIHGSIGTGKTTVMRVLQRSFVKKPFKMANSKHIARDCVSADKPMKIIDEYGRHSYRKTQFGHLNHQKPIHVCFDDLGAELSSVKHYGNDLPVMEDIIQDRYVEFIERGLITHFTTNLNGKLIEETYGKRTRDRIREMCNSVDMDGESLRK